jgi:hypothetical protein
MSVATKISLLRTLPTVKLVIISFFLSVQKSAPAGTTEKCLAGAVIRACAVGR